MMVLALTGPESQKGKRRSSRVRTNVTNECFER